MGKVRLSRKDINSIFSLKNEFPEYFRYHGRKISKRLSKNSINLINECYDEYSLDNDIIDFHQKKNFYKSSIISLNQFEKVNVEIGFGDGEFLIKNAISRPNEFFIGSEFYINGIVKVLKKIIDLNISNLKISNLNSLYLLKSLPINSVDKMYIINPDPWKKKKHHKRRLISSENIELFHQVTKAIRSVYITTDSNEYLESIKKIYEINKNFYGSFDYSTLAKSDLLYGISRYQRKAIKKGRKLYLIRI
tara:strand:+ start:90 stop:836 length:747 start_codon:yes stop_codon:yes gene_type:complete